MKVNILVSAIAGALVTLTAFPALGHHATSTFYRDEPFRINGTIQEVIWANPHGVIVLKDAEGAFWVGEMAAILSLSQQGLSPEKIPAGMEIEVEALPSRDGTNRMHIQAILVDGAPIYGTPD